jgi:hypothetical protein
MTALIIVTNIMRFPWPNKTSRGHGQAPVIAQPIPSLDILFLDDLMCDDANDHSDANNAIHMYTLKTEHFLDTEPGYSL